MDFEQMMAQKDARFKEIQEKDKAAKEAGTILGRYVNEPMGDGYAYYEVVKINKKSVRLQVLTGLWDDWILPYWGDKATVDRQYVEDHIRRRDGLSALFGRK